MCEQNKLLLFWFLLLFLLAAGIMQAYPQEVSNTQMPLEIFKMLKTEYAGLVLDTRSLKEQIVSLQENVTLSGVVIQSLLTKSNEQMQLIGQQSQTLAEQSSQLVKSKIENNELLDSLTSLKSSLQKARNDELRHILIAGSIGIGIGILLDRTINIIF